MCTGCLLLCTCPKRRCLTTEHCCGHAEAIVALAKDYQPKGLAMAMISSNSIITHPQDGPEKMAEDAQRYGGMLHQASSCCWYGSSATMPAS